VTRYFPSKFSYDHLTFDGVVALLLQIVTVQNWLRYASNTKLQAKQKQQKS